MFNPQYSSPYLPLITYPGKYVCIPFSLEIIPWYPALYRHHISMVPSWHPGMLSFLLVKVTVQSNFVWYKMRNLALCVKKHGSLVVRSGRWGSMKYPNSLLHGKLIYLEFPNHMTDKNSWFSMTTIINISSLEGGNHVIMRYILDFPWLFRFSMGFPWFSTVFPTPSMGLLV